MRVFAYKTRIMTSSNRIYLFDTTLRDGAQTQGVDFTVADAHSQSRVGYSGDLPARSEDRSRT